VVAHVFEMGGSVFSDTAMQAQAIISTPGVPHVGSVLATMGASLREWNITESP
jgi:hypothetical protein